MAVNKRWIIGICSVIVLAVILILWHGHQQKPKANTSTRITTPATNMPPKPLTAGGQPVPPSLQQKARTKGYYCSSWDTKPGQAAPDVCYSLDQ